MNTPRSLDRLGILNADHPWKLSQGLHFSDQLRRSWYFFVFAVPELPESIAHANNWNFFRHFRRAARPAYTAAEIDRHGEAWSQRWRSRSHAGAGSAPPTRSGSKRKGACR